MPRGKPKRGEFDFTIWFADGARFQWCSTRQQTDADIAFAIRRYLVPVMEGLESANAVARSIPMLMARESRPRARNLHRDVEIGRETGEWKR